MKNLKRVLVSLVLIGLLVLLAFQVFKAYMRPQYQGTQSLSGLSEEVRVYFDSYGIPHIYANSEADAFKALGYVHAQDRLWQMEVLRRIGAGRLSELFGADLIETDKLFLSLGIDAASEKSVAQLETSSASYQLSMAYLDGINAFIASGPTPVEFLLTGTEKKAFELKDIYNTIGYMAFSFAVAHRTDPLLSEIHSEFGPEYLKDLSVDYDPKTLAIATYKGPMDQIASLLEKVPAPQFIGSNAWVIGSKKTKNGSVIFANDPHIGYAQPAVWYEAHIQTPTYENYGHHLAGVPFPLLAHNRKLAYGLTMFENDDIDFYSTETQPGNPDKYKYEKEWLPFRVQEKTIVVKDATPVNYLVKQTVHGPIMNDIVAGVNNTQPISMSWVYTQKSNEVLQSLYRISHARGMLDFKNALSGIHAPGLNVMYGDAQGNIAWWATAALYDLPEGVSSKFILDGRDASQEKISYLPFSENPSSENPPWDYVYSANNAPQPVSGKTYPGYYLPENRAKRINNLLLAKDNWDINSVSEMITDHTSAVNPDLVKHFMKSMRAQKILTPPLSIAQQEAIENIESWDGSYGLEQTAAALFHKWEYYFLKNVFEDELGVDRFKAMQSTHFFKRLIAPMIAMEESVWFDQANTPELETKDILVYQAFLTAFEDLSSHFGSNPSQWKWSRIHTLEHEHPIGKIAALRSFFNVGPFPSAGSKEVINNIGFNYTEQGGFQATMGPSTRRVIDFSQIERSMGILPTGQSGNPFSPHYKDQALLYNKGAMRPMLLHKQSIEEQSKILVLKP
ncbi:penicillin acylase family protein [Flavobacteriaceae bacterium LSUCC0859]|nr:penicillin acylase family protein [Flavobacteriaceae bacterium LSUCC0859]